MFLFLCDQIFKHNTTSDIRCKKQNEKNIKLLLHDPKTKTLQLYTPRENNKEGKTVNSDAYLIYNDNYYILGWIVTNAIS